MNSSVFNNVVDTFVSRKGDNNLKCLDEQIIQLDIINKETASKIRMTKKLFSKTDKVRISFFAIEKEIWLALDFGKSIREYFKLDVTEEIIKRYEKNLEVRGIGIYFQIGFDGDFSKHQGNIYKIKNEDGKEILDKIKEVKKDGIKNSTESAISRIMKQSNKEKDNKEESENNKNKLQIEDFKFDTDAKIYRFARNMTFETISLNARNRIILPITAKVKLQIKDWHLYEEIEDNWRDANYENIIDFIQEFCDNVKERMDNNDDYRIYEYSFFTDNINLLERGSTIMNFKNKCRMVKIED